MTGSDVFAWNSPQARILVVMPNWLGDGIMAMPALQHLRSQLPKTAVMDVLARPHQAGLWNMHPAIDTVQHATSRTRSLPVEIRSVKSQAYTHALILPHSFRSGLLPFLSRVPCRRGTAYGRPGLITDAVDLSAMESRHQQWENALILLGNELPDFLPSPQLIPPDTAKDTVCEWLADLPRPLLGLLPGAARGPSKQWPAERFLAVARTWQSDIGGTAVWMGTPNDRELCRNLAERCGPPSTSFAGDTSLPEFTALLAAMQAVVANDSGGMHLAAAVGTPVVGIFGQTDPGKTAPLHPQAVVVKAKGSSHRAIRREDPAAVKALASIPVEEVLEPVLAFADSRA